MKYKAILTLIFGLSIGAANSRAQEIIATVGNYFENSNGSIEFTIGEPVTATLSKNDIVLTQGFHQPVLTVLPDKIDPNLHFDLTAYPNPTQDYVILETDHFEGLNYQLCNLEGKLINQNTLTTNQTEIDFSSLEPSLFFLRIYEGTKVIQTFKIIKN